MNVQKIPNTGSIAELAKFWDENDVTDFEDQLEEVTEPVFALKNGGKNYLKAHRSRSSERSSFLDRN